jgi:hypothetical protein
MLLSLGPRAHQLWKPKVIVPAGLAFSNVMVGAFVVAILYFAREILAAQFCAGAARADVAAP